MKNGKGIVAMMITVAIFAIVVVMNSTNSATAENAVIPPLEVEWTKIMGTGVPSRNGFCGRQTKDGGYIISGFVMNEVKKSIDLLLMKLNASRNVVWQKQFGGVFNVNAISEAGDVQEIADGYLIGGESSVLAGGGGLVMKTDLNGNMVWQHAFGGSGNGYVYSLVALPDGGCIAGGYILMGGRQFAHLIRFSASGVVVWEKDLPSGQNGCVDAKKIIKTSDGCFAITGVWWVSATTDYQFYLAKIDINGNLLWNPVKTFGGPVWDWSRSVQPCSDGGFIMVGSTFSFLGSSFTNALVIKTDKNGKLEWQKEYGGPSGDWGAYIQQVSGGYVVAGITEYGTHGGDDVWIFKIDRQGNLINQISLGGPNDDEVGCLSLTADGGCLMTGRYVLQTSDGGNTFKADIYLAKIKAPPAPISGVSRWKEYE